MSSIPIGGFPHAKFLHQGGTNVGLRLQCFLKVVDDRGRIASVRLEDDPEHWLLPGELMLVNEDPKDAAQRVAKTYFESGLEAELDDVVSFPATGPEDTSWYVLFIFRAKADPAALKGTADTVEIKFTEPGTPPGEFGFSHHEVFERLR